MPGIRVPRGMENPRGAAKKRPTAGAEGRFSGPAHGEGPALILWLPPPAREPAGFPGTAAKDAGPAVWNHSCSSRRRRAGRRRKRQVRNRCGSWESSGGGMAWEKCWCAGMAGGSDLFCGCHVSRFFRCGSRATGGGQQCGGHGDQNGFHDGLNEVCWECGLGQKAMLARLAVPSGPARQKNSPLTGRQRARCDDSCHRIDTPAGAAHRPAWPMRQESVRRTRAGPCSRWHAGVWD